MENEMSFVHHTVKWYGCGYTIEDDENLNGRIQRPPMSNPSSSWCKWGGNKGGYWVEMVTRVLIRWIGCLKRTLMTSSPSIDKLTPMVGVKDFR